MMERIPSQIVSYTKPERPPGQPTPANGDGDSIRDVRERREKYTCLVTMEVGVVCLHGDGCVDATDATRLFVVDVDGVEVRK